MSINHVLNSWREGAGSHGASAASSSAAPSGSVMGAMATILHADAFYASVEQWPEPPKLLRIA
jgi:hypothetical protein